MVWLLIGLLALASLLPLLKFPFGAIRGLAFPRQQFFLITIPLGLLLYFAQPDTWGLRGIALLAIIALFQLVHIVKFTPVWSRQSVSATNAERQNAPAQVSLLAANIKKSNRDYDRTVELIMERGPDIAMAIEVDVEWVNALSGPLRARYPYWVEVPMDNGYGLCVMSKLQLIDAEVRKIVTDGVPSIRTGVRLRDGRIFRLYVVHPEPPVFSHDTIGRDSEIALIGLEAQDDPLPAVVTGDLNDVAWSTTTRRFQRLSGLLDPRVGRGFYNTFSATMPWMRWPLDHLFHDPRFRLVDMQRLRKVGSDHFPMWFVLALAADPAMGSAPGNADVAEEREAQRMIAKERRRDREALGSDWEDET